MKPTTWEQIVGRVVPGWREMSERNQRAVRAKGSVAGYHVDWTSGAVTRK